MADEDSDTALSWVWREVLRLLHRRGVRVVTNCPFMAANAAQHLEPTHTLARSAAVLM